MICQIIVAILLYCLISGKYKNYVSLKIPIPGLNTPFILSNVSPSLSPSEINNF